MLNTKNGFGHCWESIADQNEAKNENEKMKMKCRSRF